MNDTQQMEPELSKVTGQPARIDGHTDCSIGFRPKGRDQVWVKGTQYPQTRPGGSTEQYA